MRRAALALCASLAACAVERHAPPTAGSLPPAYRNAEAPTTAPTPTAIAIAIAKTTPIRIDLGDSLIASLIARAQAGGPDVAAALARLAQARAIARQAGAARTPEITGRASVERRQTSQASGASFGPPRLTLFDAGFDASWEADLFGRLSAEARAARGDRAAAALDLQAVRTTLAADVARFYVRYRALEERRALAERSADAQAMLARIAEARGTAGLVSNLDPARARALAQTTRASIADLVAQREDVLGGLAVLVGTTAAELGPELATGRMPDDQPLPPVGPPADLLANRPDVQRDLARLAAADDRTAARVRDRLPRLTLSASGGASSSALGSLFDPAARAFSIGSQLAAPLIDFGRRKAIVDQARAVADERAADLQSTLLAAIRETETALAETRERAMQAAALERALTDQRRAVAIARARYASGLQDLTTVIDAERALLAAEDALIAARQARAEGIAALWKALGGDPAGTASGR